MWLQIVTCKMMSVAKGSFGVLCLVAETLCECREGPGTDRGEQRRLVDFGKDIGHVLCWTRYVWWVSAGLAFMSLMVSFPPAGDGDYFRAVRCGA